MGFEWKRIKQYLLTGVSYVIPFVACGGILIALALAFSPTGKNGAPDFNLAAPWLKTVGQIGAAAFTFLVPVLAGYIAFGIADRPGLVPGFVGGYIATNLGQTADGKVVSAGFLGGLVAGLLAGFVALQIKRLKVPVYLRPIMPILVIPVVSSLVVGFVMFRLVGPPVADVMESLTAWLQHMQTGNQVLLALIIGAMIAFDMGGPVNKAAFFFGVAMIEKQIYGPMGAAAAAICIPPIGLGLATLIRRKLWSDEEHEAGIAALAMGMIGITEGAIPFAAGDPLRVIPTIMVGSMIGAVIAMLGKVGDQAPHGGPIVLPVVINPVMYIVAILAGSAFVAVTINLLRAMGANKAAGAKEEAKA